MMTWYKGTSFHSESFYMYLLQGVSSLVLITLHVFLLLQKARASFLHSDHVLPSLMVSSGALENMNVLTDASALGNRCQWISVRLYSYLLQPWLTVWGECKGAELMTLTHLCHISQTSPWPQRQNLEWATDRPEGRTYSLYTSPSLEKRSMVPLHGIFTHRQPFYI